MEKLSEHDPLAISAIQFNIKSIKKYTSVVTIILSLGIVALSFIVSIDSISQIWAPLKDLPVSYSLERYSQKLQSTGNPICITSSVPFTITPNLIMTKKVGDELVDDYQIPLQGLGGFSYMQKYVAGKDYVCYDLGGSSFINDGEEVTIDFSEVAIGESCQIYLKQTTIQEILYDIDPQIISYSYTIAQYQEKIMLVRFTEFTLKDRLFINYEPTVIKGFLEEISYSPSSLGLTVDQSLFRLRNSFYLLSTVNVNKYTIQRMNIGQILSEILAWRGIILIPIAIFFIMLPFADSFLKVDLIKARYTCPEIDNLNFSVWACIKQRFSACCGGRQEQVLNHAMDSIDNELDILQILRKQTAMKQRINEVETIQKPKDIFSCEVEHEEKEQLFHMEINGSMCAIGDKKDPGYDFKEEEMDGGISGKCSEIVMFFDETETPIQVLANGGKGYGSVWNMLALFVLSGVLLFGLIFLGLFDVAPSYNAVTCIPAEQEDYKITLGKDKLVFRPKMQLSIRVPNGWYFNTRLVDGDLNVLKVVSLRNGTSCPVPEGEEQYTWYCLGQDIEISSKTDEEIYFAITLATTSASPIDKMVIKTILVDFRYQEQNYELDGDPNIWQGTSKKLGVYNVEMILKKQVLEQDGNKDEGIVAYSTQMSGSTINPGLYIKALNKYTSVNKASASYWEMIDNAWGLVILSFELIIYRICKFINSSFKNKKIDPLKEQHRSDILSILNDVDRLSKGSYNQELTSVKHYFKQRLDGNQNYDP